MGQLTIAPTQAVDLLETVRFDGRGPAVTTRAVFKAYARQVAESTAVTIRDVTGRLCVIVGVCPQDDGEAEVWFGAGPNMPPRQLLPVLRAVRDVGEAVMPCLAPCVLTARVHPDSVAGSRLASWFGLELSGAEASPFGPLAVWTRRF